LAARHSLYYERLSTQQGIVKDRLAFIDWTRGMATLIMLQGHVWESFTDKNLRETGVYVLSQFPGGVAPAVFLFLAGVTLAFLIDSREKKGATPWERSLAALRRAGYLGGLAILFRFQMWLFYYPYGAWSGLLRVDILNCMGAACVMLAPVAALRRMQRVRGALFIAALIAFGAPLVSDWKDLAPNDLLRSYFAPDYNGFSLFPWGTFVAAGMAGGTAFRLIPDANREQVMQWVGWGGFALAYLCQYLSNLPYGIYPNSEFWLDSPCLTLIKCGVILMVCSFAFFWNEWAPRLREASGSTLRFSIPRQLGTTSLLIYWVHIEIVYGRWFDPLKGKLSLLETAIAAVVVVVSMIGLSYGKRALVESEWFDLNVRKRLSRG
jgi:uncharacterized membrane protein